MFEVRLVYGKGVLAVCGTVLMHEGLYVVNKL